MTRLETKHFVLKESLIDDAGDSTWSITYKKNRNNFYVHVFGANHNRLNIKVFRRSKIRKTSEAISALCNHLVSETGEIPYISIHDTNETLIGVCKKAGFQKVEGVKHLYTFKVKGVT